MSGKVRQNLQQVIFCDMCTEEDRKPARKTCMKCEISKCIQHLQAHLTTPALLQTHPLTDPLSAGNGGLATATKCPQHGKLLEYYCLDDLPCVCVSCAIEDKHSKHNMKTFSTAHKELMERVTAEQQALLVKTDDESMSLGKWEKSDREKLGRSSVHIIEALTNLQDLALISVHNSVSARVASIRTSKSSLQAAKTEEDAFRFLQMYSQVHQDLEKAKVVDLRQGLEPGSDRDKLLQEIRQSGEQLMEQGSLFLGPLLTHVDPENHLVVGASKSDPFFDPLTFGPGMSLSKNKRKVFYSGWQGRKTPFTFLIQDTESSTDHGIHRWVISLSSECDWTVGLCNQNYTRESVQGDIYGLCWKDNQLKALKTAFNDGYYETCKSYGRVRRGYNQTTTRNTYFEVFNSPGRDTATQVDRPKKVEVLWSHRDSLSFYSVTGPHQKRQIVTMKISPQSFPLVPFVGFEMEESKSTPVNARATEPQLSSAKTHSWIKQWKCSCGSVCPWNNKPNFVGHYSYQSQTCGCGKNIGVSQNTEVLCELL